LQEATSAKYPDIQITNLPSVVLVDTENELVFLKGFLISAVPGQRGLTSFRPS
jgi:hypothetical protein